MQLYGTLFDAGGPLSRVTIVFTAERTTLNGVIVSADRSFTTQEDGTYSISLEPGYYAVHWIDKGKRVRLGHVVADVNSEMSLPEALEADYTPMQPSYIQGALDQMQAYLSDAESRIGTSQELIDAKNSAAASANAAASDEAAADQHRIDAEAAANAAAVAGEVYADTAAGLAATTDGEYFKTPAAGSDGFLTLWRNDSGSATEIDTFPSLNGLATAVRDANQKQTRLARSLQRLGDRGQTLHADFAYDAYGLGSRMSGGVDTALDGDELFTVQRSTPRRVLQPSGPGGEITMTEVPVDAIAREFDPLTGEPLGASIEDSATNELLYSDYQGADGEIPPSGWSLSVATAATTTSPSARKSGAIATTHEGENQRAFYNQNVDVLAGVTYTLSVYFGEVTPTAGPVVSLNGGVSLSSGQQTLDASDVNNGNFNYITFTPDSDQTITIRIGLGVTTNTTGKVTHEAPQLEQGDFPSSYTPTVDSPVTRASDVVSRVSESEFNKKGFTALIKFYVYGIPVDGNASNRQHILSFGDGGVGDERLFIYLSVNGSLYEVSRSEGGGINTDKIADAAITAGVSYVLGISIENGIHSYFLNGVKIGEKTTQLNIGAWSEMNIGSQGYIVERFLKGGVSLLKIIPNLLSDSELVELTS